MPILYLVDTNTLSNLSRQDASSVARLKAIASDDRVYTCFAVMGEWEYGIHNAPFKRLQEELRESGERVMHGFDGVLESSPDVALQFGLIQAELRKSGQQIPVNDVWIAAVARAHDATIVTSDLHFGRVSGISVTDWARP